MTGADGFVGQPAARALEARGHEVVRLVRRARGPGSVRVVLDDLTEVRDWRPYLRGIDVVVHLAARAHVLKETERDPQQAFERANVNLSTALARAATSAGVRRLVFVSSIGVNGNGTDGRRPFRETDEPRPVTPYARSKLAAERALEEIARSSSLQLSILRPPLIYGPGAKGNLMRMLKLVASGLPVPLGSVRNRRSLVGVDDLCQALALAAEVDSAAGQTFLIAEPEPRSTPEIFSALYRAIERPNRLVPFSELALRLGSTALGLGATYKQLCGSLEVDSSKAREFLGWSPRTAFEDGMREVAQWYVARGLPSATTH
jgi:UDP-4-keto-D-QuiNAc 4-reductase